MGTFAPKFAQLNDDVLFGQVWSREMQLSLRDRSLVTVVSLMSQNGITRQEIAEILTHAAFYAGWPKAWAAFRMAKEVWKDEDAGDNGKSQHQREMVFPIGAPNDAFAQYFVGQSYLYPLSTSQVGLYNVTFEPGCRNNWHIHHAEDARELQPGDVVNIPAGVKHWHGAAPDSWFSHLALEVPGENCSNEWLEAVSDAAYDAVVIK